MLAVFERIGLETLEEILARALGEDALHVVDFKNQLDRGDAVPDAAISASLQFLFEAKIVRGFSDHSQLTRHLDSFEPQYATQRLFVVTPDAVPPPAIQHVRDPRLKWLPFGKLHDAIGDVLRDPGVLVPEQARYLLRELQTLFELENLVGDGDVVVVAAGVAYDEYNRFSAYVCQPHRTFRDATHVAFYTGKEIKPEVPVILRRYPALAFDEAQAIAHAESEDVLDQRVADLIRESVATGARDGSKEYGVLLLSAPADRETQRRDTALPHLGSGAWTQWQRYAALKALLAAKTTTDLAA